MSNLQEILSELMAVDAEAKQTVESAAMEAESILQRARQELEVKTAARLTVAKAEADALIKSAMSSATAEAEKLEDSAKEERKKLKAEFEEKLPMLLDRLTGEIIETYCYGGSR